MFYPIFFLRAFVPFALTNAILLALQTNSLLHAAIYYWDMNNSTVGFGTAGGGQNPCYA